MTIPTAPFALAVYRMLGGYFALGKYDAFVKYDEQTGWTTSKIVTAMCAPLEEVYAAFTDGAWLDPQATPDSFVRWLAGARGVDGRGADLATLRTWIPTGGPTRQRGGDEAIVLKVQQVLTGTKSVRIYPRTDPGNPGVDSPGHTFIRTRASGTPGGTASVIAAARDRAAAAWQLVHAQVLTGKAWDEMTGTWSAATGTWEDN